TVPVRDAKGTQKHMNYTRYLADGGIYTADQALSYGLVDQIGYLEDALTVAKQVAGLGDDYKVVTYEQPPTLMSLLFGAKDHSREPRSDLGRLSAGATPRLWYLAPQSELAGILAAVGQKHE